MVRTSFIMTMRSHQTVGGEFMTNGRELRFEIKSVFM